MASGSESTQMRVLVVAAVRLYRDGIAQGLACQDRFHVVGTASSAAEAMERLPARRLDVALVDVGLPGGLDLVRALCPEVKVVALAVPEAEQDVIACAEAGAAGFVTLDGSLDDLGEMLESVGRGETLCSPRMAAALLRRVATLAEDHPGARRASLTAREHQIMELVEQGLSNKEIARELLIEVPTVKNHVHNILEKMHVRRRADAAAHFRGAARLPVSAVTD